jgi:hypothetical protein
MEAEAENMRDSEVVLELYRLSTEIRNQIDLTYLYSSLGLCVLKGVFFSFTARKKEVVPKLFLHLCELLSRLFFQVVRPLAFHPPHSSLCNTGSIYCLKHIGPRNRVVLIL